MEGGAAILIQEAGQHPRREIETGDRSDKGGPVECGEAQAETRPAQRV